jgi:hypothetical protein
MEIILIDKILILSRFEVVQIIHNIKKPNDLFHKEFIVVSCFGNKFNHSENCNNEYTPNTLLTSLKREPLIRQGMVDHVNVFCDDITPEQVEILNEAEPGKFIVKLFDEQNAKDVVDFIDKYKDSDYALVVHCDAGISRSSAHAIAIGEQFGFTEEYFMEKYPHIQPNQHILKLLRAEKANRNK